METALREAQQRESALKAAQLALAESIVATVREPLLVLDENMRVVSANRSFYRTFRAEPDQTLGKPLYSLGNRQWDIPALRRLLEDILPRDITIEDFEMTHMFATLGLRTMLLNARRIVSEEMNVRLILLAIEDVTERIQKR
jgi:two-component system cell cycle sensor histidine kinase PleC